MGLNYGMSRNTNIKFSFYANSAPYFADNNLEGVNIYVPRNTDEFIFEITPEKKVRFNFWNYIIEKKDKTATLVLGDLYNFKSTKEIRDLYKLDKFSGDELLKANQEYKDLLNLYQLVTLVLGLIIFCVGIILALRPTKNKLIALGILFAISIFIMFVSHLFSVYFVSVYAVNIVNCWAVSVFALFTLNLVYPVKFVIKSLRSRFKKQEIFV